MSAVVRALSHDGQAHPDPELNVETVFKEPEPVKDFFNGGILPFVMLHKKSIFKLIVVFLYYIIGCIYYNANMEWDALDCIYFITVSITTVGYGDYSPDNNSGRIFTCFFVLLGIVVVFGTINDFAQSIIARAEAHALEKLDDDPTDDKAPHAQKIALSILAIFLCVFMGAIFFYYNEDDFSFNEAFYWSFITTMTVGYGDLAIEKDSSRAFSIFYILFSVILVAAAIGNFGAIQAEIKAEKDRDAMLSKKLDIDMLRKMDVDGGGVSEMEFLIFMLVQMKGLDQSKDIDPWLKRFRELDADGSGALDEDDIKLFEEQEAERRAQAMARNHSQDHTPPPRGSGGSKDTNSTTIKNALLENSY